MIMAPLVVIEAPGKQVAIQAAFAALGMVVDVRATKGHLLSGPDSLFPLAIAINDDGEYEDVRRVRDPNRVRELLAAADGRHVYVATDDDAEGHVIARDVAQVVASVASGVERILLRRLDPKGVEQALEQRGPVKAAHAVPGDARRMLDRWIGHTFTRPGKPVGRVQTALLRALSEQEPIVGHVVLALPSADGKPWAARVPVTASTQALWQGRAQELAAAPPALAQKRPPDVRGRALNYVDALLHLTGMATPGRPA